MTRQPASTDPLEEGRAQGAASGDAGGTGIASGAASEEGGDIEDTSSWEAGLTGKHFRKKEPALEEGTGDGDAAEAVDDAEWPSLDELPQHHHHHHRSRRRRKLVRRLRVAGVALLVVGLVAGGVALGVIHMIDAGAQAMREASQPEGIATAEEAQTKDDGLTVEYDGATYRYNENMVSIVVMGYDRREDVSVTGHAGQADAIMVVALDTQTGEMRVIGVPRDTMVDVDENVGDAFLGQDKMQIALAFSYGDGYETSATNVVRAVSRVLYNMPMSYYFAIDMDGIGPLNDAVGGVTLTPLASIPNTGVVEGRDITLYGSNALRYVQHRDTSQLDSSLQRQARQSQYLQAFFSQAISNAAGNPAVLVSLYQTAPSYSTTNLELSEFTYLASVLLQHGMSQLDVVTLGGEPVKGGQYVEYHLDQQSVYETALDVFYTPVDEAAGPAQAAGPDAADAPAPQS